MKKYKFLSFLLILLFFLNLHDLIWTYLIVTNGFGRELNPFMKFLLDSNPIYFIIIKIVGILFAIWLIWKARVDKRILIITFCLVILYSLLVLYQMVCSTILQIHFLNLFSNLIN